MEKSSPIKRFTAKWTGKDRVGYLFIFPAILVLFVFTIIPLVISFIISLTNLDIFLALPDFVGLENFKRTLGDERVWNAFKNTFYYVVISVPIQLIIALVLAYWICFLCTGAVFLYRHRYLIQPDTEFHGGLYPLLNQSRMRRTHSPAQ